MPITFISGYGNVAVASLATQIFGSNPLRKGFLIGNNSNLTLYIGMDANVTATTGYPIAAGGGIASDDFGGVWKGAVWGVCSGGTGDIRYWEFGP